MQVNVVGIRRNIKNFARKYSDAQIKVREATSNDPWGPSSTMMAEIAELTYNVVAFSEIMAMIWKRLNDHGRNWRHVYKSLVLLEYLAKTASERVPQQCKENIFAIKTLQDFTYVEEGRDHGRNVRDKAKHLTTLLEDEAGLKEERRKALNSKDRYHSSGRRLESAREEDAANEEEMQLQLALAMSREEAELEQQKQKSDEVRLQLALSQSEQDFKQHSKPHSHMDDLLDLNLNQTEPLPTSSNPWGAQSAQSPEPKWNDPWADTWSSNPQPSANVFSNNTQTPSMDLLTMSNSNTSAPSNSFLGANSALVDLDNLFDKKPNPPASTNPFLDSTPAIMNNAPANNGNLASAPFYNSMQTNQNGGFASFNGNLGTSMQSNPNGFSSFNGNLGTNDPWGGAQNNTNNKSPFMSYN